MNKCPRLTRNRQKVIETLQRAQQPLSAAEIVTRVNGAMDQATVYRSLLFLEDRYLIESFLFECKIEGILKYYTAKSQTHYHYFHCEKCHRFIAVEQCNLHSIAEIERKHNITINNHTVCYRGICAECAYIS